MHAHYQTWQDQRAANYWTDADYGVDPFSTGPAAPPLETRNNQQDTITRLGKIKNELEESAWTKLQTALEIMTQNEVQTDLSTCIDDTPRGAVDALKQVMQALGMCQLRSELWNDAAAKKVRDSLSVRTQLAAFLLGNKKKYHSVL